MGFFFSFFLSGGAALVAYGKQLHSQVCTVRLSPLSACPTVRPQKHSNTEAPHPLQMNASNNRLLAMGLAQWRVFRTTVMVRVAEARLSDAVGDFGSAQNDSDTMIKVRRRRFGGGGGCGGFFPVRLELFAWLFPALPFSCLPLITNFSPTTPNNN